MKKIYTIALAFISLGFYSHSLSAQQDAQYTQYTYNTLSINPAYAGSREVLSFVGLYRTQWVGLDGAPTSFTFSGHSPIGKNVGLGLNVNRDEIFFTDETFIDASFSYTLNLSEAKKLAFGISGGVNLLNVDFSQANEFQSGDALADAQPNIDNRFSPRIGAGVFYYTNKFYLGLSVPSFLETEHFDESSLTTNSSSTARERANVYLMGGYAFDLTEDVKFKPSTLLKFVEGAPLQVDLSANFLIKEKLTLGAAYRWSAAFSAIVGFQVSDQIAIGVAYDRDSTELRRFNDGSYEAFLRYELFNNKRKRLLSPRFF